MQDICAFITIQLVCSISFFEILIMPFTLAHTVIASPISKILKNKLPIAALAIGSMTPDLFRLFSNSSGLETHAWNALIYPNLILGLAFCGLWYGLFRPTIYSCLTLKDDLNISNIFSLVKFLGYVSFALIIGNTTHILWDGFTHLDSRTLIPLPFFESTISLFNRQYSYAFILQIVSSVLPLPFIFYMIQQYYKKHKTPNISLKNQQKFILCSFALSIFIGLIALSDYASQISYEVWLNHQYYFLGRMLNKFTQAALICFSLCCIIYQYKYFKKNHN